MAEIIDQKKLEALLANTGTAATGVAPAPVATTAAPVAAVAPAPLAPPTTGPAPISQYTITVAPPAATPAATPAPVAVIAEPELPPEPEPAPAPKTHIDKEAFINYMRDYHGARYPLRTIAFVCSGYGCQFLNKFEFPDLLIDQLKSLFADVSDSEQERKKIAKAIGMIERAAGPATGTVRDRPSIDFGGSGDPSQLDCVDEAINSTSYMIILHNMGLIKYHSIERPDWKGGIFRWTHFAAILVDETTEMKWAVDAGIGRNGAEPLIVEFANWYE